VGSKRNSCKTRLYPISWDAEFNTEKNGDKVINPLLSRKRISKRVTEAKEILKEIFYDQEGNK